jgi:hypothetical protein
MVFTYQSTTVDKTGTRDRTADHLSNMDASMLLQIMGDSRHT